MPDITGFLVLIHRLPRHNYCILVHNPVICHVTRYKRIPVLLGYTQVIHRILTGYTKVMHRPAPVTSCAQGPEGEGEVPLTRGGTTLFDISISIWNILGNPHDVL